ncbi:MAG: hypothetical protein R3E76_14890 [Planctomycetota bacterium]
MPSESSRQNPHDTSALDDAPTPIGGSQSVGRVRRMTAAISKRNWQGAGLVALVTLLFIAALIVFMYWKSHTASDAPSNQTYNED